MATLADLTRKDVKRDNRFTVLPSASLLGFGLYRAKRGNWVQFRDNDALQHGRVLGGVTCEGTRYIECIVLLGALDNPCVRWVLPDNVLRCEEAPPARIFAFICGDWSNVDAVAAQVANGFARTAGTLTYAATTPGEPSWHEHRNAPARSIDEVRTRT